MKQILQCFLLAILTACSGNTQLKTMGTIERLDPVLDKIISPDAKAEIIAEGFDWSEGPLWIEKYKMLVFSDVPKNTIYKWTEKNGKEVYLTPSGYTSTIKRGGETGSNGLTLDKEGNLVLCQHGDRRMARMDAPLDKPEPKFITLADKYDEKRFNSPNDAVFNNAGELFFTDPPYGLEKQADDPKKETAWNGVYKVKKDGSVILLVDSITRPNGIAFFPGEQRLIVASSDPDKPNWYVYDVKGDSLINARPPAPARMNLSGWRAGTDGDEPRQNDSVGLAFGRGKIFYSAAGHHKSWRGLPDGLKIDKNGNVFATGPGGVYFFNSEGKKLGMLKLENATSNCALSPDEKTLYITNDMYVLRLKLRE